MGETSRPQSSSSEDSISGRTQEIGKAVQLNTTCDPYHRISNKMQTFMTYIDLIPIDWNLNLNAFTMSAEDKKKNKIKGLMNYNFKNPIITYEKRCKKYGLLPASCLRVLSCSESNYSETYANSYEENKFNSIFNNMGQFSKQSIPLLKSAGVSPEEIAAKFKENTQNLETGRALKELREGPAGGFIDTAMDVLFKGRNISLPKIYQGSTYSPSLNVNVKLISPYGDPKSIKKWVLEPLIYFLLLTCPDTNDGISYGGSSFIKARAHGMADINIGYITNITVNRGGNDIITNKFGQPLNATIKFDIVPLMDGFACLHGDSPIEAVSLTDMLFDVNNDPTAPSELETKPGGDFGMTTIDNIIRSFNKFPGSDYYTNNGEFPSGLSSFMSQAQGAIAGAVSSSGLAKVARGGVSSVAVSTLSKVSL